MKKKDDLLMFTFLDREGKCLQKCKLASVPLRADAVLCLSVEFFNDPEPCMIHRSAVMNRMYMEILEYFLNESGLGKTAFAIGELPDRLESFFSINGCCEIRVELDSGKASRERAGGEGS